MTIKEKVIEYRNSHKESRVLLGVLLGEFERLEKSPKWAGKEVPDTEYVTIVKKLITDNIECGELEENKTLEQFVPQQLTPLEIIAILNKEQFIVLGDCMKFFKTKYTNLYDGKMLCELFNNSMSWQN